jgi:tetratricopeptide (TPR) repeat protein
MSINDALTGNYERSARFAHELTQDRVSTRHQAWGAYNLANLSLLRGHPEEAVESATEARDLLVETGDVSRITADGLLGVAQARGGQFDEARATASELLDRLAGDPLSSYTRLEGYAGPAEVYVEVLEAERRAGRELAQRDVKEARRALKALKRYCGRFSLGQPRLWHLTARVDAATGRTSAARKGLEKALERARDLHLPCEEGRVLQAQGMLDGADEKLAGAEAIFEQLGCAGFLASAREARA